MSGGPGAVTATIPPPLRVTLPGVTQTLLHDPDRPEILGNCVQAAVATLLDLPLDAVPHFVVFTWWTQALELWARGRGLTARWHDLDGDQPLPDWPCVASGPSPRGVSHSVVSTAGRVVWDPHPSRAGLVEVRDLLWFERWPTDGKTCWACSQAIPALTEPPRPGTPEDPPPPHCLSCVCGRRAPVQATFGGQLDGVAYPAKPNGSIAWWEHEKAWEAYVARYGASQSAERIAERAGFGYGEVCAFLGHEPTTWSVRGRAAR